MSEDPTDTNPHLYPVVIENDRVRVLEYRDAPGDRTLPHRHPDSVMITLSGFSRRLIGDDRAVDVELERGTVRWLPAQRHAGQNIGDQETHAIFVKLKEAAPADESNTPHEPLGPRE